MRVDARSPGYRDCYWVYDVPAAKMRKDVVWIDTDTAQLGFYVPEVFLQLGEMVERRKKITLVGKTFLLDPIEDGEPEEAEITPAMLDREVEHG